MVVALFHSVYSGELFSRLMMIMVLPARRTLARWIYYRSAMSAQSQTTIKNGLNVMMRHQYAIERFGVSAVPYGTIFIASPLLTSGRN